MSMRRLFDRMILVGAALLLLARPLGAQSPPAAENAPPASGDAPESGDFELAKDRFKRGRDLFKQQAWGAALAEFLESRKLFPTQSATAHAAECLKKLERYDESLDMYAALVRDFSDKLSAVEKQAALESVEAMRKLVGTLEIEGAETGAAIVIDQRERGNYPLVEPLRVPAGRHFVRVYKEGYEPFQSQFDVAGGTAARVTVRMRRLKETGTLRVIESTGREMEVVVDGIGVGKTPLRIPVAPGKHVVLMRGKDNFGTAPASVTVQVNDTASVQLEAERLTASLRVVPTPFDALVSVDSVFLGRGVWEGRVRPGQHTIEVGAEGFLAESRKVLLLNDKKMVVPIELARDPKSPFWRKPPPPPHFLVEVGAGPLFVPSFGGDVAGSCAQECSASVGVGNYGVVRGGYQLSSGFGFGLTAGYLSARQTIDDRSTSINVVGFAPAQGTADDVLSMHGALVGAWIGYSLDAGVQIELRVGAGGLLGTVSDGRLGTFPTHDGTSPGYGVGSVAETHDGHAIYVTPEVRVGLPLGRHVQINVGLEVPILFGVSTPTWSEEHAINTGPDGYGWFNADALKGRVLVGFAPSVGARFDL